MGKGVVVPSAAASCILVLFLFTNLIIIFPALASATARALVHEEKYDAGVSGGIGVPGRAACKRDKGGRYIPCPTVPPVPKRPKCSPFIRSCPP